MLVAGVILALGIAVVMLDRRLADPMRNPPETPKTPEAAGLT